MGEVVVLFFHFSFCLAPFVYFRCTSMCLSFTLLILSPFIYNIIFCVLIYIYIYIYIYYYIYIKHIYVCVLWYDCFYVMTNLRMMGSSEFFGLTKMLKV